MTIQLNVIKPPTSASLEPVCCRRDILDVPVGGATLGAALNRKFEEAPEDSGGKFIISIHGDVWPSPFLVNFLAGHDQRLKVIDAEGRIVAWLADTEEIPDDVETISLDSESVIIRHSWDFLAINEEIVGSLSEDIIKGVISDGVNIDGNVVVGEGTVLLPGVYVEGNAVFGKNCKIGPNCYIRGNTSIGDDCHIGQAVEVKNSILMNNVGAGHLSYVGDSIVCDNTNFGAGTITANFRHDGKNHRSMIGTELVDTGRRKFGAIIGDDVHTGIHTSIYPGRKIWPGQWTRPGSVVNKDIRPA